MGAANLKRILQYHFLQYPEMRIQDLYKLVYQGVMGCGHAVSSPESVEDMLLNETTGIGLPGPNEPLAEEISPEGPVVRVNLRPFMAMGGSTADLLRAFIRTANEFTGSTETLRERWEIITALQRRFSPEEMLEFMESSRKRGFPAVHHSFIYRERYHPSYRVVLGGICREEGILD